MVNQQQNNQPTIHSVTSDLNIVETKRKNAKSWTIEKGYLHVHRATKFNARTLRTILVVLDNQS